MTSQNDVRARARHASEVAYPWIEKPGWALYGPVESLNAVMQMLATCENHGGVHHFARVHQGRELIVSHSAVVCLGLAPIL